jgi:hypothetical protein
MSLSPSVKNCYITCLLLKNEIIKENRCYGYWKIAELFEKMD